MFNNEKQLSQWANARIIIWSLILAQYQYKIVHKAGKDNLIADCLSRLPKEDDLIINTPFTSFIWTSKYPYDGGGG